MTTSTSRIAFSDCFDLFDQALGDSKGLRVRCPSFEAASHLRMRLHTARTIDRKDNKASYDKEHKLHGRSPFDEICCRILYDEQDTVWLYLDRVTAVEYEVEALSEVPQQALKQPEPKQVSEVLQRLLEAPKVERRF